MTDLEKRLLASPSLPTIPPVAQRLLELLGEDAPFEVVTETISADASLTTQLLRTVNSAAYGSRREITSLHEAVVLLGATAVRSIALSFAFVKGLRDPQGTRDLDAHWRTSLMSALAARGLCRRLGVWDREEAFLIGLISDVGALVLFAQIEEYRPLFSRFIAGGGDLHELERQDTSLRTSHTRVGAALLELWGFPRSAFELVRQHHSVDDSDSGADTPVELQVLNAAWVCARTLSLPAYGHETPELLRWIVEYLKMSPEQAVELLEALPEELREIAQVFEIPADQQRSYHELLISANEQLREVALRSEEHFRELSAGEGGRSGFDDLRNSLTLDSEPETGLLPRSDLELMIDAYMPRARQRRCPLGVLAIEIERAQLRRAGEKLETCDLVQSLLDRVGRHVRSEDEAARLGPSRIALLLLDCEGADLLRVGRRIQGAVCSLGLEHRRGAAEVEIALGGADLVPGQHGQSSASQLIDAATEALDRSRGTGEVRLAR